MLATGTANPSSTINVTSTQSAPSSTGNPSRTVDYVRLQFRPRHLRVATDGCGMHVLERGAVADHHDFAVEGSWRRVS